MKKLIILSIILTFLSYNKSESQNRIIVPDPESLKTAIKQAVAGDEIILANGIWKDTQIKFFGKGTITSPITLRAETPGKVSIEGISDLQLGGSYLEVKDLYFKNGYTPSESVIRFKINNDSIANNCKITNTVIEDYTQPDRDATDHWVEFWGRHNALSNCYLTGKSNYGPTIMIKLDGNEHINNYHQIINNHFGPRPRRAGPHAETIQLGNFYTSMMPSYTLVANNLFDRCNGEIEVISSKSNYNEFKNNVFFESEGSLVVRHGNFANVNGNIFIGNDNSEFIGGIRVVGTGHWIINNYLYKIKGKEFRSPLSVMNGTFKASLNRYQQVTDAVIAYNTFIDCKSPWQISVGSNVSESEVLPPSEIRSARPERVVIANNIIFNEVAQDNPIVNYDKVDGINFQNNIINYENKSDVKPEGLKTRPLSIIEKSNHLFVLNKNINETYFGFDFEKITKDIFGNQRTTKSNSVGAFVNPINENAALINKPNYGTNWFQDEEPKYEPKTFTVSSSKALVSSLEKANSGDIISLKKGIYHVNSSLPINKEITITSNDINNKSQLIFTSKNTAFEMFPAGHLNLKNVIISGNKAQNAFTTLDKNMLKSFNLFIDNVEINNFKSVLETLKGSLADSVSVTNSTIKNCERGFMLNSETDDQGDYNAEFVTITNTTFNNINESVVDYYRGGYDESTIGGCLLLKNNTFTNCGAAEKERILIKNIGIVNVLFSKNTFKNNPVDHIAILWGAKGQEPGDNIIDNSGKIEVVQNLRLKLNY